MAGGSSSTSRNACKKQHRELAFSSSVLSIRYHWRLSNSAAVIAKQAVGGAAEGIAALRRWLRHGRGPQPAMLRQLRCHHRQGFVTRQVHR